MYDPQADPRWLDETEVIPDVGESPEVLRARLEDTAEQIRQMSLMCDTPGWRYLEAELTQELIRAQENLLRAQEMNAVVRNQTTIKVLESVLTLPQRVREERDHVRGQLDTLEEG